MKELGLVLLALALVFRAAPICAAQPEVAHIAMPANCEGMADHKAPGTDHDRGKAAQACHACAFPVAEQLPSLGAWFWKAPTVVAPPQHQLAGSIRKPPTPPPRADARSSIQHQSWS